MCSSSQNVKFQNDLCNSNEKTVEFRSFQFSGVRKLIAVKMVDLGMK